MHKIAVIDSMICNSLVLKDKGKILYYWVKNQEIHNAEENIIDIFETHGTEVINNILYECNDVQILAIKVLEENGKGKVYDLLEALKFCISQKVDAINISLGIQTDNHRLISKMEELCRRAVNQGTTIVAANNNYGSNSYPAAFDFVVSVSTEMRSKEYTFFNRDRNEVCFCSPYIFSKGKNIYEIKRGNSYLCGYVTGVLCAGKKMVKDPIEFFWDKKITRKYYINPFSDDAFGKNTVLIYFEDNPFDIFIEKNIKPFLKKMKWDQITGSINFEVKTIILGTIGLPVTGMFKKELLERIIRLCNVYHTQIYTVVPIFSMKERYDISKEYGIDIKTIYI